MTQNKTKKALLMSVLSMVLCVAMLVGMTFAWFTDTASTGVNKIVSGKLDVSLEMKTGSDSDENQGWVPAENKTLQFKVNGAIPAEGTQILWEPGCTYELPELRVVNNGNLALKYKIQITGIKGDAKLNEVIDWTINGNPINLEDEELAANAKGDGFVIRGHMQETANNDYQKLSIDGIAITVVATQLASEFDSIGNDYDALAEYPVYATATVSVNERNTVTEAVTFKSGEKIDGTADPVAEAIVHEDTKVTTDKLELIVNKSTKPANLTISTTNTSETLEVKMKGLDPNNEKPLTISLFVGKDLDSFVLYHHDVAMTKKNSLDEVVNDQDYYYDRTNGIVTFKTAKFSPFTYVYNKKSWSDMAKDSYSTPIDEASKVVTIANAGELALLAKQVNGGTSYKGYTVKLVSNIDLENGKWVPIGKNGSAFQGVFDGQGHTISNLIINTSNECNVGLFGFTKNGEVKNFTLKNAMVKGYLEVGAVAGTPYTSKYTNIKLTGDVKVDGYAYVGGMFGKNAYANLTDLTISVNDGSYVKANSEDYRTYIGGLVGFMGEGAQVVKNVTSNIDVTGSTCDVGGITGIAHYGNSFINCHSSGDVTLISAPDSGDELEIGGIAGVWHDQTGKTVTFEDCSYTGKLSSTLNGTPVTEFENNGLVGRKYGAGAGTLIIK